MMKTVIKSKRIGKVITFSIPGNSYIYTDLNGGAGLNGQQICAGGKLTGSTLLYEGNSEQEFRQICTSWLRSYYKQAE